MAHLYHFHRGGWRICTQNIDSTLHLGHVGICAQVIIDFWSWASINPGVALGWIRLRLEDWFQFWTPCIKFCPCLPLQDQAHLDYHGFFLATNPFYLWLICTIFSDLGKKIVPETLTQLYMFVFAHRYLIINFCLHLIENVFILQVAKYQFIHNNDTRGRHHRFYSEFLQIVLPFGQIRQHQNSSHNAGGRNPTFSRPRWGHNWPGANCDKKMEKAYIPYFLE